MQAAGRFHAPIVTTAFGAAKRAFWGLNARLHRATERFAPGRVKLLPGGSCRSSNDAASEKLKPEAFIKKTSRRPGLARPPPGTTPAAGRIEVVDDGPPALALPETDPAYQIISMITRVVPSSHWAFARIGPAGKIIALLSSDGGNRKELSRVARGEFRRQQTLSKAGSRISATLGNLGAYESGITLLFADARTNFGILTLLRTATFGPFTSSEISMLTFALDAASDRFSAFLLGAAPKALPVELDQDLVLAAEPARDAFYVLDEDLEIVLAWSSEDQRRIALTGLRTRIAERLPRVLEETVRELTAGWSSDAPKAVGVGLPVPFLVVRTQPMSGPAGLFIGVRIDRFRPANSLTGAADRFHISRRELQVLALLLDGNRLDQIALQLHIATSTVQDHLKSMLGKTASRNRSELIARVLGWESMPKVDQVSGA